MDIGERQLENQADIRIGELQLEMQTDISRISAYGYRFPSSFVGYKFDGPLVVALFTELDPHQRDLLPLLDHPDRVRVETSPYSRVQLERTRDELATVLADRAPGAVRRVSIQLTKVDVTLTGNEGVLALELYQRFGDAIRVRLGNRVVDPTGNFVGPDLHPRTV